MNPPTGLEPTPHGLPVLALCPHCHRPLPPVAKPAVRHAAQQAQPGATLNARRAVELEDATPTQSPAADRRLAPTEIVARPSPPRP